MTQSQMAKLVAHWVLTDNFEKLETFEDDYGCITTYLDEAWDQFANDAKLCAILEKAYNKWTSEY